MSAPNSKTPSPAPLAARPGSAGPNPETIRFVEKWLWESDTRQTVGQPWTDDYVRDAARMVEEAVLFLLSPNSGISEVQSQYPNRNPPV